MINITMCHGGVCPYKTTCHRYQDWDKTIPIESYSYFAEIPLEINNGKYACDVYWGWREQEIFTRIQQIINSNKIK